MRRLFAHITNTNWGGKIALYCGLIEVKVFNILHFYFLLYSIVRWCLKIARAKRTMHSYIRQQLTKSESFTWIKYLWLEPHTTIIIISFFCVCVCSIMFICCLRAKGLLTFDHRHSLSMNLTHWKISLRDYTKCFRNSSSLLSIMTIELKVRKPKRIGKQDESFCFSKLNLKLKFDIW